jgi:glycerol-3-phosphate dehydrogenase
VPSHAFRATLSALGEALPELDNNCRFCWGTKGLEATSGKLLNEVFDEVIGQSAICSALSGPSFAREVAAHLPTALTVAADDKEVVIGGFHDGLQYAPVDVAHTSSLSIAAAFILLDERSDAKVTH